MSRDQRRAEVRAVDPATGATSLLLAQSDPVWLDVVAGVPALLPDGRLVTTADSTGPAGSWSTASRSPTPPCRSTRCCRSATTASCWLGTDDPNPAAPVAVDARCRVERPDRPGGMHIGAVAGSSAVVASVAAGEPATVVVQRSGTSPAR
jgi:dipeptidyl-peptidase-4